VTYRIRSMTADDIPVLTAWHYPPPYDFYDPDADDDDLAELSDPDRWGREYFTAVNEQQEIVGFFQFRLPEPGTVIEIGLGLRPDLTGIGLGSSYMAAGMDFARERWHRESFQLFVAAFNRRAIKVYERLGFRSVEELRRFTGGARRDFVRMEHVAARPT
jgi:[ribosomal protein S18]-alanine N-acetyltransferase